MSDTTSASLRRHEFWTPRIALAVTGPEGPLAVGDDLDVFEASDTLAECRTVGAEHATLTISTSAENMARVLAALGASDE